MQAGLAVTVVAVHDVTHALLQAPTPNVVFDESGNFIIFAGLLGIKVSVDILFSFNVEACLLPCPALQPIIAVLLPGLL
jgi:hypothetical protein